jgi:hypothetical protein
VKEETGFDVEIKNMLFKNSNKYTFVADIIGGKLYIDLSNEANNDIIDVDWVCLDDRGKFDSNTTPLLKMLKKQ